MKKFKLSKIVNIIYSIFFLFLLAVLGLTFLSVLGIPKDNQIYVVESASMEPAIYTGSVIFVSPAEEYKIGDVITYKARVTQEDPNEYTVTHRITNITQSNGDTYYQTKGDNNDDVDPLPVHQIKVIGKVRPTVIPGIGYVIGFAKTPPGFVMLILLPSLGIIILEILSIVKEIRQYIKKNYIPMPKLHTSL